MPLLGWIASAAALIFVGAFPMANAQPPKLDPETFLPPAPAWTGASEKLMFWLREHGALAGHSVAAALEAGTGLAKVARLAAAWARERGASHGATSTAAAA